MTVRELMAALRIHDPDMEVVLGKHRIVRSGRRGIDGAAVGKPGIVYRINRLVVELGELTPSEAATAVPVVSLWPE